jgi:xylulokinase
MPDLVIGLDAGTSACKAIAVDIHGQQLAEGRAALDLISPGIDLFEQRAEDWWQAACISLREITEQVDPRRIAALAIAHQRESFVLVDRAGTPLRNAILWMDERSRPYLDSIRQQIDPVQFHQRTGKPLTGNLLPGKLAWLRDYEPRLVDNAYRLLDTHAYLIFHLTGKWATSTGSADPLGLFDMQHQDWDATVLEALGLQPTLFPHLCPPGKVIGHLTPAAALLTGLPEGLPVISGIGDGQAAALGTGIAQPGYASLSLGTSVISGTYASTYQTAPAFRTMTGGLPHSYVLETVILGGAHTLKWLTSDFLPGVTAEVLETDAGLLPPGSDGLLLVPYWNSAMSPYWDTGASGITVGWRAAHRPAHFYRAVLEGIAFELRLQFEGVEKSLGHMIELVTASGGGSKSSLWLQILADVLGKPISCTSVREAACLGACILAASGSGLFSSAAAAARKMITSPADSYQPSPAASVQYSRLYEQVYLNLYPALREPLRRLSDLAWRR